MPRVSLIVCVHGERELLERLLQRSGGSYDDLLVVHDGPDATGVKAVVDGVGGRFVERPRACQQEPHWPFAWGEAKHDWILRLDADEFPGGELKDWLQSFRQEPEPAPEVSGFTCIWPLWNGQRAVTRHWPTGRHFLFHRGRVRFFGMVEQVPVADGQWLPLPLTLHHEPRRKSYGVWNIVFRRQAYRWRRVIASSLMGSPVDLPCWRWEDASWPAGWEAIRKFPLRTGLFRLLWFPVCQAKDMVRAGEFPLPSACLNPGLHHLLLGCRISCEKWRRKGAR